MKKIIPFIISYLIIATGLSVMSYRRSNFYPFYPPSNHVPYYPHYNIFTKLSHDELVAKLQQVGLSDESKNMTIISIPPPLRLLVSNFGGCAMYFGIFLGLAYISERFIFKSRPKSKPHEDETVA